MIHEGEGVLKLLESFFMNELVCEYKGQLIESEEMKSSESQYAIEEMGCYLYYFFNSKGRKFSK